MNTLKRLLLLLFLPLALASCGDDDPAETPEGKPAVPTLVSSDPASGAVDVPVSTKTIVLTFSEPMNMVSGKEATFNGEPCSMSAFSKKGEVMTFTIPESLKRGETYELFISGGYFVSQSSGMPVLETKVTFSTEKPVEVNHDNISKALVTPNAMTKAQKVYDFLLANYGTKVISAACSDVAWNFNEANLVNAATGKYPAINAMDYIHLCTNRADWTNKYWVVDYSLNADVRDWVEKGGILAAGWHWNVPKVLGAEIAGDGSSYTYKPDETNFKPSNVLVEGTAEKKFRDEDYALIAKKLLELQEAGIAVLWRPFHEASGNWISGGDPWFWWGKEGAEVYKKLWIDQFNYFKEAGVRNLIWVWTTQSGYCWDASKGLKDDKEWYPGDEYVDIVGRDEYMSDVPAADRAARSAAEFEFIQQTFPNKIVALSECGSVASVPDMWNAGAHWSYVMPWSKYNATTLDGHDHADTNWWKTFMGSDLVITRDMLPSFE